MSHPAAREFTAPSVLPPWLPPSLDSLLALAHHGDSAAPLVRDDPAAVLLLLTSTDPLREVLDRLPAAKPDTTLGEPLRSAAAVVAHFAETIATRANRPDPHTAHAAGVLTCLSRVGPDALTPAATLRKLGRSLPQPFAGALSHFDLPFAHAVRLGADPDLTAAVRLALFRAASVGLDFGLVAPDADLAAERDWLGLSADYLDALPVGRVPVVLPWRDPVGQPLLPHVLRLAMDNRRLAAAGRVAALEREAESLHEALRRQTADEADRLHEAKMSALAEFAAGAGHEVNNPLAVISGEAQYIAEHCAEETESDEEQSLVCKSVARIVAQTQRVHGIIRELMQFARPGPTRLLRHDAAELVAQVFASLGEFASSRGVRLEAVTPGPAMIDADAEQFRTALSCLARNAIEAAGPGGWARLRLTPGKTVTIAVEDSGPGPSMSQVPHLFDPFYSGRNAGRGRGLGLPIAWRLMRRQGGEVRLMPRRGGVTCFAATMPSAAAAEAEPPGRLAA